MLKKAIAQNFSRENFLDLLKFLVLKLQRFCFTKVCLWYTHVQSQALFSSYSHSLVWPDPIFALGHNHFQYNIIKRPTPHEQDLQIVLNSSEPGLRPRQGGTTPTGVQHK